MGNELAERFHSLSGDLFLNSREHDLAQRLCPLPGDLFLDGRKQKICCGWRLVI